MADGEAAAVRAGLVALLLAAPGLTDLVGQRVVDEPGAAIAFPYVRIGRIVPTPDDTDGARGFTVSASIEAHSRPGSGHVEAERILAAVRAAVHRAPAAISVAGFTAWEIETGAAVVARQPDGATYIGTLALDISLDVV